MTKSQAHRGLSFPHIQTYYRVILSFFSLSMSSCKWKHGREPLISLFDSVHGHADEKRRFETRLILSFSHSEAFIWNAVKKNKKQLHPQASKRRKKWQQSSHAWEKLALTFLSESPVITQVTTCYCSSRACWGYLSISLSVSPSSSVPLLL